MDQEPLVAELQAFFAEVVELGAEIERLSAEDHQAIGPLTNGALTPSDLIRAPTVRERIAQLDERRAQLCRGLGTARAA